MDALTVENLSLGNDYDRSIESARLKQTHAMQSLTEKQMAELEPEMKNWSRRKYLLLPLNLTLLYATFKYPRHLSNFTRKWIQRGGKPNLKALLALSLMQAGFFASTLITANCMVIGINPFRVFGRMRHHWGQTQDLVNSMEVSQTNVIPGLP